MDGCVVSTMLGKGHRSIRFLVFSRGCSRVTRQVVRSLSHNYAVLSNMNKCSHGPIGIIMLLTGGSRSISVFHLMGRVSRRTFVSRDVIEKMCKRKFSRVGAWGGRPGGLGRFRALCARHVRILFCSCSAGVGLMFTAGGQRGLSRIQGVASKCARVIDLSRVGYRRSVPRATRALRNGTLRGTHCVGRRFKCSYFTSSANLRMRTLRGTPKMCSTHCTNPKRSSRTGVSGLLRRVRGGGGQGTHFHAMVTLVLGKGRCLFRNVIGNAVVGRGENRDNFKCSPVFIPSACSRAFTRVNGSVGGRVDRHTRTIGGLATFLSGCAFWCYGWCRGCVGYRLTFLVVVSYFVDW